MKSFWDFWRRGLGVGAVIFDICIGLIALRISINISLGVPLPIVTKIPSAIALKTVSAEVLKIDFD